MRVVALNGPENSGKSHTINVVYSLLLEQGFTQIPGHFRELGNPIFSDFIDILFQNSRTIGIVSMGDYQRGQESLKRLIQELKEKGCYAVICACRDVPGILNAVQSYSDHVVIEKTISTGIANNRIVNWQDAQTLIGSI